MNINMFINQLHLFFDCIEHKHIKDTIYTSSIRTPSFISKWQT